MRFTKQSNSIDDRLDLHDDQIRSLQEDLSKALAELDRLRSTIIPDGLIEMTIAKVEG